MKNYFVQYSSKGSYFQGITGEYSRELLQTLQGLGAESVQVMPLALEEIIVALAREGA